MVCVCLSVCVSVCLSVPPLKCLPRLGETLINSKKNTSHGWEKLYQIRKMPAMVGRNFIDSKNAFRMQLSETLTNSKNAFHGWEKLYQIRKMPPMVGRNFIDSKNASRGWVKF